MSDLKIFPFKPLVKFCWLILTAGNFSMAFFGTQYKPPHFCFQGFSEFQQQLFGEMFKENFLFAVFFEQEWVRRIFV